MKIEHVAFNVADPVAVAQWYCKHCGLRVIRHIPQPVQTHFLADSDSTALEIYCNPPDQIPDYFKMNPLQFHLALASSNPAEDAARLVEAGASIVEEVRPAEGTLLIMMRDPWGLPLQLCKRAQPLLPPG